MSDMKCPICPICGGDLIKGEHFPWFYSCQSTNWKSDADKLCELDDCAASVPVWETLQRTRKALEVAVDGIKYMRNNCLPYAADYMDKADDILEQIKKVEQEKG